MNFPSIDIQGSILSAEILGKIRSEQATYQQGKDFITGLNNAKLKDEISFAWQEAKGQWMILKSKLARLKENQTGTTETRNFWMMPLLTNLGYQLAYTAKSEELNGKMFPVPYRDTELDNFPVYIGGFHESLDKRPVNKQLRVSPHAMLQEYLNYSEHLYGIVTNGRQLRLLRDASRITRLSYVEFNLEKMMEEDLYSDFVILFRLLHSSRMPRGMSAGPESIIEKFHQEGLEAGSTIRNKLGEAVKEAILSLANGFINHPDNKALRDAAARQELQAEEYFRRLLRVIYRMLFLFVTEERNLIYAESRTPETKRFNQIYFKYYSLLRLRKLAKKLPPPDAQRYYDLWESLLSTFSLFEEQKMGSKLGLMSLEGDLFGYDALCGAGFDLHKCRLNNALLLRILKSLSYFENDNKVLIAVNYGGLDVEEFGSVYEGLLELKLHIEKAEGGEEYRSYFDTGNERSKSGSHYTPEELVQPLIKHSLEYIIEERIQAALHFALGRWEFDSDGFIKQSQIKSELEEKYYESVRITIVKAFLSQEWKNESNYLHIALGDSEPKPITPNAQIDFHSVNDIEKWWEQLSGFVKKRIIATGLLLSIKVCDVACGSGHILLSAARRIALEIARENTYEEQPNPMAIRKAMRDVIRHCIYGVDKNDLAVELCKIALWLESHNPGEPLSFLDHHIKCGDSIVGLARKEELHNGISEAAFKKMPGDDSNIVKELLKKHKSEAAGLQSMFDTINISGNLQDISLQFSQFEEMPEHTIDEVKKRAEKYNELKGSDWWNLKEAADLQVAQFFIPKTREQLQHIATYSDYVIAFGKEKARVKTKIAKAMAVSAEKKFFHWFLEFPEIMLQGGFDCILGNPPFLGGLRVSKNYGYEILNYLISNFSETGSTCDFVAYFFRRAYELINNGSFVSLLSTNTIAQGATRNGALEEIIKQNGNIIFAIKSTPWPGQAAVHISVISIYKGNWFKPKVLNQTNNKVDNISSYLDDSDSSALKYKLMMNECKSFIGSFVLGQGFILTEPEVRWLIEKNQKNSEVIYPYIGGDDINSTYDQSPSRYIIFLKEYNLDFCETNYPDIINILTERVKPERELVTYSKKAKEKWWIYERSRMELYSKMLELQKVIVISQNSKPAAFTFINKNVVIDAKAVVITSDSTKDLALLQSSIHTSWAWKHGTTLGVGTLTYTPTEVFQTFPFPLHSMKEINESLSQIGQEYYEFRKRLMLDIRLGLTKTYNLFHCQHFVIGISNEKASKNNDKDLLHLLRHLSATQGCISFEEALSDIIKLRELHKQMDEAVLKAYGWGDIDLAHNFYEVDYLPENDRVRYTISPTARKEVLKRLLELNYKIHAEEVAAGLWDKKKGGATAKKSAAGSATLKKDEAQGGLFG